MRGGKSFGALKGALQRVLKTGYAPELTNITVMVGDRERLRQYCELYNYGSMVEAFNALLNNAGVSDITTNCRRGGKLECLIGDLKIKAGEFDKEKLASRIKSGEFDQFIQDYAAKH